jgi:single-stranded DNA-binding protein
MGIRRGVRPSSSAAGELKKGDRVYIEGTIKLDSWRGQDGVERSGLSVASFKIDKTHQIGRNKPRRRAEDGQRPKQASSDIGFHSDEIPF